MSHTKKFQILQFLGNTYSFITKQNIPSYPSNLKTYQYTSMLQSNVSFTLIKTRINENLTSLAFNNKPKVLSLNPQGFKSIGSNL